MKDKEGSLGFRMKEYEKAQGLVLNPKNPYAIRIDGHKFSNFTKPFLKPFDPSISSCMIETATDLLNEFNASIAYTASDEITLIFPFYPDTKLKELNFGGKVQKMASLTAGFASAVFNYHLSKKNLTEILKEHVIKKKPYFDSRVFQLPSDVDLVNNLLWRQHYDWRRNSISTLAQTKFSHKQLNGINSSQILEKLKKEKDIDWNKMDDCYKFGTFIKKEKYTKESTDNKGQVVQVIRTRSIPMNLEIHSFKTLDEKISFVTSKYLNEAFKINDNTDSANISNANSDEIKSD